MTLTRLHHALACLAVSCLHGWAAAEVPAATSLRETVLQVLVYDLTVAQSVDALKWYDSQAGRQITAMEEAFSANFGDMNQAMAAMQISSTVAVMQGLANALPNPGMPAASELRKALAQYVKFLPSKSSTALTLSVE